MPAGSCLLLTREYVAERGVILQIPYFVSLLLGLALLSCGQGLGSEGQWFKSHHGTGDVYGHYMYMSVRLLTEGCVMKLFHLHNI